MRILDRLKASREARVRVVVKEVLPKVLEDSVLTDKEETRRTS